MRDCLQNEPDERPSAKDLVNRLAGSTHRSGNMLMRNGGSLTGGHISGQLLADGRYVAPCWCLSASSFAQSLNTAILWVHMWPTHHHALP